MMNCPSCREEAPDKKFCDLCGTALKSEKAIRNNLKKAGYGFST